MELSRSTQSQNACRLCGGGVVLWVDDEAARRYERCPRCGAVQLASVHLPPSTEEHSRYLLHDNDPDNLDYRRYVRRYIESSVLPYLPRDAEVLDFGSGPTPMLSTLLEEERVSVRNYDPFFAPNRGYLEGERRYDAIVALEVLEHLHRPAEELERLLRLLRPAGALMVRTGIFRTGEKTAPGSEAERFLQWWYRRDSTHVWFLTPQTVGWMEERYALRLVHHRAGDELVFRRR